MAASSNLTFNLFGKDVSASKAFRGVAAQAEHTNRSVGRIGVGAIAVGSALGGLVAGGITAAIDGLGSLVSAARDEQAANRITAQVIKTTGGAAHVTAAQVDDLATAISNKTGVDDDAIKSSENLLLTFTGVRNEVGKGNDIFNQATAVVTDMSVALGQDGKSSAIQLGKALNDPIKGLTALQRVGVSFTEDQKKQIQNLATHGKKLEAQKLILKELGREFGGAAAAASDPMKKLSVQLENTGKALAVQLLPYLNMAAAWISNNLIPAIKNLLPKIGLVASWLGQHLAPVFQAVANFITNTLVPTIANLAAQFMQNIWPAIKMVVDMVVSNLQPAITALVEYWTGSLWPAIQRLIPVLATVAKWIGIVVGAIVLLTSWILGKLIPVALKIVGVFVTVFSKVMSVVAGAVEWVINNAGGIVDFFKSIPGKIGGFFTSLAGIIIAPFRIAFNSIASLWNNSVGKLSFHVPDWVPGMGGKGFDVPDIPMLANGGIVTRPTLALIGERGPEAVIPLNRRTAGGVVINITQPLGTPEQIARAVTDAMKRGSSSGRANIKYA